MKHIVLLLAVTLTACVHVDRITGRNLPPVPEMPEWHLALYVTPISQHIAAGESYRFDVKGGESEDYTFALFQCPRGKECQDADPEKIRMSIGYKSVSVKVLEEWDTIWGITHYRLRVTCVDEVKEVSILPPYKKPSAS